MSVTEEQVAEAFIAALNGFTAAAYDFEDIPATLPTFYTEVTVARRYGGNKRSAVPTITFYRATTRAVAKYSVANAREVRRRAAQIEGVVLTVNGETTTPVEFESAEPISPDDGWYSGLTTWTFGI